MFKANIIVAIIQQLFYFKFNSNLNYLLINRKLFEEYKPGMICFVFIIIQCVIKEYAVSSTKINFIYQKFIIEGNITILLIRTIINASSNNYQRFMKTWFAQSKKLQQEMTIYIRIKTLANISVTIEDINPIIKLIRTNFENTFDVIKRLRHRQSSCETFQQAFLFVSDNRIIFLSIE